MECSELSSISEAAEVLGRAEIKSKRFQCSQFEKYFSIEGMRWLVLLGSGKEPKAMLAFQEGTYGIRGCYVAEIQAFESGCRYGKMLLEEMLRLHPDTWLIANWECDTSLLDYYRGFQQLRETWFVPDDWLERRVFYGPGIEIVSRDLMDKLNEGIERSKRGKSA